MRAHKLERVHTLMAALHTLLPRTCVPLPRTCVHKLMAALHTLLWPLHQSTLSTHLLVLFLSSLSCTPAHTLRTLRTQDEYRLTWDAM